MDIEVTITSDGSGAFHASPDPVGVQRATKDRVVFINASDLDCMVCFTSSPFGEADLMVPKRDKRNTPRVKTITGSGSYAYDLVDTTKFDTGAAGREYAQQVASGSSGGADPQVIVR